MSNIIELENISFSYGQEAVFVNLSFGVKQGDFVALIGPNGAGKSTALKLITGLLAPTNGSIRLFGQDIQCFTAWQRIGYVPQNPSRKTAFPATVEEVVGMGHTYGLRWFRGLKGGGHEDIREKLEMVGMWQCRRKKIGELSGGQQQRVFVAKALVGNPKMLLLDEPATGIDGEAKGSLYRLLHRLNSEMGIAIVMVSHDVEMAMGVAKQVFCIDRGLCFAGTPEEVSQHREVHGILFKSRRIG